MLPYVHNLISIAITTYNHEKFIEASIKSALAQDYPNIEILISDDASTDGTIDIIRKYVKSYPNKIKCLISKKSVGAVSNFFKCVSACNGKYIIGLSGDDEFYPNKLSKQIEIMEKDSNIAICYADAAVFDVASQKVLYNLSDKSPPKSGDIETALSDCIYYSPTMMFRRSILPKENTFNGIKHGADLAFYKEIMILSAPLGKIYYLPEVIYKYQKHNTNITVTSSEYRKEHIEAIKILQQKYPEYKACLDPSIYDFCCVAFFRNLSKLNLKKAMYFLLTGLKASRYNPFKFLRSLLWGINFIIKTVVK